MRLPGQRGSLTRRRFLAATAGAALTGATGLAVAVRRTGSPASPAASPAPSPPSSSSSTRGTAATTTTPAAPATTPPSTAPPVATRQFEILCREAWGAAPPAGRLPEHHIERLTVHHTAVTLTDNRDAPGRLRGHQRYHQRNGFTDIAYHLVVDAHGHVYEGRATDQPGETFTDYQPAGHLLVTLEGNFDEQALPDAQLVALADVLAWAADRHGMAPETITGHRDLAHTSCPGDAAYQPIADGTLVAMVRERLTNRVDARTVCGPEAAAVVAAVEGGRA